MVGITFMVFITFMGDTAVTSVTDFYILGKKWPLHDHQFQYVSR